jgi:hypothetical protein
MGLAGLVQMLEGLMGPAGLVQLLEGLDRTSWSVEEEKLSADPETASDL